MKNLIDLPKSVPVFPLPGALLLPRARLPLNIFEPRYLAMLDDALSSQHRLIGMVQPRDTPNGEKGCLHKIGCAGRVTSFSETEDGRYLITLSGVSRFRIADTNEGFKPYICADVQWDSFSSDLAGPRPDHEFDRPKFLELLGKFFESAQLHTDWDSLKEADEELLINSLSMLCPFAPEDKQALLEAPCLQSRRETLTTLMEFELAGGMDEDRLQ
ncbi:MAG: LON peptidase substrate-binding domain-containing protein [Pseudomonadota bacterium]